MNTHKDKGEGKIICKILGHKWDLNRNNIPEYTFEQHCKRCDKWIKCDYVTRKQII